MSSPLILSDSDNLFFQKRLQTAKFVSPTTYGQDPFYLENQSWLLEVGSMTKRFESLDKLVTISPHIEQFVEISSMAGLLDLSIQHSGRLWQRDITLYANHTPWLIARTWVPEETLHDDNQQLIDLGTVPLGRYLFTHPKLVRSQIDIAPIYFEFIDLPPVIQDACSIANTDLQAIVLWARQSILLINQLPLQLTELFLPQSPLTMKKIIK